MIKANVMSVEEKCLIDAIYEYHKQKASDPLYIVMNSDTRNALAVNITRIVYEDFHADRSDFGEYMGTPIAVCEKLKFGEIELI